MTPKERTIKLMEDIEQTMDNHNGMFGDAGTLCLFCGSDKHDGKEGIIHHFNCQIKSIRYWIKNNGGSLKL